MFSSSTLFSQALTYTDCYETNLVLNASGTANGKIFYESSTATHFTQEAQNQIKYTIEWTGTRWELKSVDLTNGSNSYLIYYNNSTSSTPPLSTPLNGNGWRDDVSNSGCGAGAATQLNLSYAAVAQPTITSVSVPANSTYKVGDNLTFSVTFSENVVVNTTGGTPFVPVTIGSAVKNAAYVSGTGSSTLVFRYTVADGDFDLNGVAPGSAITLNGGTIKSTSAAANASLTLNNIGSTAAVFVDGIAPTVSEITRAGADNTNATSVQYRVTFSEHILGIDISDFTLTTSGTAKGTVASVSGTSGTSITVTVNSVSGNGTIRLDINASGTTIVDDAGNAISGGYNLGEVYTIVQPSNNTDYFRSITSGNWNNTSTWESSTDNIAYHPASLTPDFNANQITILTGHTVNVTANVAIDQTTIDAGGAVVVNPGTDLTINDGTAWDLVVNGSLTVAANGNMIITSTAAGTASIGNSAGMINGNVIYERYAPSRRSWRLTTTPLTNANTIREAWQNSGTYTPGMGTFVTGPGGTNGLDNGNNYSLKTYNTATQQLENVINTNVSLSGSNGRADNMGYFLFVRGDRDPQNLTPPNSNVTTLSAQGNLQIGTQVFTASDVVGNFTLVGNPYASPVNFNAVTRNNIAKRFYAWDPALNNVGGYVLLDDMDGDGSYSMPVPTNQTHILQSGQAVFIQTESTGPASVTFEESSKSDVTTNPGFRTNNGSSEIFRATIYAKNNNNTTTLVDGLLVEYNNKYSSAVNIQDGLKMQNINETLAIERDGKLLSLERRPLVDAYDTLFLKLTNTTSRDYSFRFDPTNISPVVAAYLEDDYLKTSTPLSMTEPTTVDFIVVANTPSANANRFRIVFKTASTLPITAIDIKASEQNTGIQVDWMVGTESGVKQYQVERSADGQHYDKVSTVAAVNNNTSESYSWLDESPLTGSNLYRIKAESKVGEIKYSRVVTVKTNEAKANIFVYPNPVISKIVNLRLNNQPKGKYVVRLFNTQGQKMMTRTITHLGGSATQTIPLSTLVSKGIYQLQVTNGNKKITQQVIVP